MPCDTTLTQGTYHRMSWTGREAPEKRVVPMHTFDFSITHTTHDADAKRFLDPVSSRDGVKI